MIVNDDCASQQIRANFGAAAGTVRISRIAAAADLAFRDFLLPRNRNIGDGVALDFDMVSSFFYASGRL